MVTIVKSWIHRKEKNGNKKRYHGNFWQKRLWVFDGGKRCASTGKIISFLIQITEGTHLCQVECFQKQLKRTRIEIKSEDLRIDVFKSSGAGGQNVQKNATAVRITHYPSGLVVACQNERSQLQNRANALRVLRSRLLEIAREEQEKQLAELKGEYTKTEWGSQIRSYVLHPYQMVKDHRTEHETGNTIAVLDGEIGGFIEAYLRWKKI